MYEFFVYPKFTGGGGGGGGSGRTSTLIVGKKGCLREIILEKKIKQKEKRGT